MTGMVPFGPLVLADAELLAHFTTLTEICDVLVNSRPVKPSQYMQGGLHAEVFRHGDAVNKHQNFLPVLFR